MPKKTLYTLSWSKATDGYELFTKRMRRDRRGSLQNVAGRHRQSEPHLLVTKFRIPPVRAMLIERPHLIEGLTQSRTLPLVLLSASAGSGKTTLLSAWANQGTQHVCWLSLDEQDNDPIRFWASVIAALRTRTPALGDVALAQLHATPSSPLSVVLTSLINDLAVFTSEITLLLDDYHLIEEPAIHSSFVYLLDSAPACLHVILSSRVDPPLALSRWRARGQMAEIRDADLRWSEVETTSFLRQVMGLDLGEDDVRQLAQRTEGWIAGLQLAALALRRHADPSAWVRAFSGSHRFLLDYVQEEILKPLPAAIQQFLLQTAILTEMNAALCQALTAGAGGEPASQELLEYLERANLFVIPLDEERGWYRFHDLFREALLARLRASQPELIVPLHRCAAAWYAAQERWVSAISHAFEAEDQVLAADLIERLIASQRWHNEYHTLRRWLARLSSTVLRSRPDLSFMYVYTIVLTSQRGAHTLDLVGETLDWAEQSYREASNQIKLGSVLALRAALTINQGDFTHAFALARDALGLLPESDQQWRCVCLIIRGTEAAFSDQRVLARQLLQQGLAISETSRWLPSMQIATALLGDMAFANGELHQATDYFHRTLATSDEREKLSQLQLTLETGTREIYYERPALYGLAALAYERNHLEEAEHALHEALAQGQPTWIHILTPGLLLQARLLFAQGEARQAQQILNELAAQENRPNVYREIQMCLAWLALKTGDLARVKQWVASRAQAAEPLALKRWEEEILLLARLHLAEGRPDAALDVLAHWRPKAHIQEGRHCALNILILETLALEAQGERVQALMILLEVVTRARPEGYQRLFLDEGEAMETLLKTLLPDLRDRVLATYVRALLSAFVGATASSNASSRAADSVLLDPLTPQERRVLLLLAEGASNQDIANALVISLATARKHVSNILSKLGVMNRTQAIARARAYGLL